MDLKEIGKELGDLNKKISNLEDSVTELKEYALSKALYGVNDIVTVQYPNEKLPDQKGWIKNIELSCDGYNPLAEKGKLEIFYLVGGLKKNGEKNHFRLLAQYAYPEKWISQ